MATRAALESGRGRRLRGALLVGSLCALGVIGAEVASVRSATSRLRDRLAGQTAMDARPASERERAVRAIRDSAEAAGLHASLAGAAGDRPHAAAVLAAVALSVGPGVRLSEVVVSAEAGAPRLRVHGAVTAESPGAASERIASFVSALASNPLLSSVRLAGTRRASDAPESGSALAFDLEAEIVALPAGELSRIPEDAP